MNQSTFATAIQFLLTIIFVLLLVVFMAAPSLAQRSSVRPPVHVTVEETTPVTYLHVECYSGSSYDDPRPAYEMTASSISSAALPGWVQITIKSVPGVLDTVLLTNMECLILPTPTPIVLGNAKYELPRSKVVDCHTGSHLTWADEARAIRTDLLPGWVRIFNGPIDAPVPGLVRTNLKCMYATE